MRLLVVDAVKPGALPLDPAPAESPFPCGGPGGAKRLPSLKSSPFVGLYLPSVSQGVKKRVVAGPHRLFRLFRS